MNPATDLFDPGIAWALAIARDLDETGRGWSSTTLADEDAVTHDAVRIVRGVWADMERVRHHERMAARKG